ncbi:hypothetical protein DEN95_17640 [Escherichia coli]|nr:hypothetical protein DEN95_17640 [Escherichia coli]
MYRELLISLTLHARDGLEQIIYLTLSATEFMHLNSRNMKLCVWKKWKGRQKTSAQKIVVAMSFAD